MERNASRRARTLLRALLVAAGLAAATAHAGTRIQGAGANLLFYDMGTYNSSAPDHYPTNNWYVPGRNVKHVLGLYHLDPTRVNNQIAAMRSSGMDTLSLSMHFGDIARCESEGRCPDGFADSVWGEVVGNDQYQLTAQHEANLRSILRKARSLGFRYVILRFGSYDPSSWTTWNETSYQKYWNLIARTRGIVYAELGNYMTRPVFDLAFEMPGDTRGQVPQFVQRLWSDYAVSFGTGDTVGASIIADPGFLSRGLPLFGTNRPAYYAFDIYDNVGDGLATVHAALGSEGSKPIFITETYHNDATTANQLASRLAASPQINVASVVYWPVKRTVPCVGCNPHVRNEAIAAQNTTTQLSGMTAVLDKVAIENKLPAKLRISDVNCATTTGNCTLRGDFGPTGNPSQQAYIVTLRVNDGARVVWACNAGTTSATAPWVTRNQGWHFEYFAVPSCSTQIAANAVPVAQSYVSVR